MDHAMHVLARAAFSIGVIPCRFEAHPARCACMQAAVWWAAACMGNVLVAIETDRDESRRKRVRKGNL
jgi:hypothetical protein